MKEIKNKVNSVLGSIRISILFIVCLLAAASTISCSSSSNSPNAAPAAPPASVINELKAVCQDLPVIANSAIVGNDESKQPQTIVYSTIYESGMAPEEIDALFQTALTAKGWQGSTEQTPEGIFKLSFRKNNYTVAVEYYNYQFFEKNLYTVKCGWQES